MLNNENKFKNYPVLKKTIPFVISIIFLKMYVCDLFSFNGVHINSLIEISDIGIIFTGTFFVVGLMLASTMTDFKESEKIHGEIACNLKAIENSILLAFRSSKDKVASINKDHIQLELIEITECIILWINSKDKDSKIIFKNLNRLNKMAFSFSEKNFY